MLTIIRDIQGLFMSTNTRVMRDLETTSTFIQQNLAEYRYISHNYQTLFCYETLPTQVMSGIRKLVSGRRRVVLLCTDL